MADFQTTLFGSMPPPGRSISLLTWTQNRLLDTLAPYIPPFGVFGQTDWPVPRGYPHPLTLRTSTSLMTMVPGSIVHLLGVRKTERTDGARARKVDGARAERVDE